MSEDMLTCEQAIFTSVRTPMGEGYRIIAASRQLRSDEKQAITRNSPSHEGLCPVVEAVGADKPDVIGASFYSLPSGRLCMALSCLAGAEHTGRGGQRVYTHSVVFEADSFSRCGFNPFNVLRSMVTAGLASPQLKPPPVLPELQLKVANSASPPPSMLLHPSLHSAVRQHVLAGLLDDRRLLLNIDQGWLESAEALLLGLPGPLRAKVSFGAGLRFSVSRGHHLDILHDEKGVAKTRIAGQPVEYIAPAAVEAGPVDRAAWITFVDRHWETGDLNTLAERTSRPFADVSPVGRERIGRLYNDIDDLPKMQIGDVLGKAEHHLESQGSGVERQMVDEFISRAKSGLCDRLRGSRWTDVKPHWPALLKIWRISDGGAAFVQPAIHEALRAGMREDPLDAAESALEVARTIPAGVDPQAHQAILDEVLNHLASWATASGNVDEDRLRRIRDQWRVIRPQCSALNDITSRAPAPTVPGDGAGPRYSYP